MDTSKHFSNAVTLVTKIPQSDKRHWHEKPLIELVNYLKDYYHVNHRMQLPELIAMAKKVEHDNAEHASCPLGLYNCLKALHEDLLSHMEKEEQILFPILAANEPSFMYTQVSLAMHNHDHEISFLNKIDALTDNLNPPDYAGLLWNELYLKLGIFKQELLEHIVLENDLLFAQAV